MKRGLVVIVILSLALVAFSCSTEGAFVPMASQGSKTVEDTTKYVKEAKPYITITATPTVEQLLNAILEVPEVSNSTKTTINYVLDLLPELEGWLAGIPAETWQAIDEIMGNVTEFETVSNATSFLQGRVDSHQYDGYEWLPEALDFGIDLLKAGENTVYNPEWFPYTEDPLVGFNVSELWKEGLEGGIAGAVGATLAGIALDTYALRIGGVVGAVDYSVADLISQLSDWW